MILAQKILMLRKKAGWSQEELAEKLNVSRQSVSKWESASSIPDIGKILELAQHFGVSTDYLLKDELDDCEELTEDIPESDKPSRIVSMQEAKDFLAAKKSEGKTVARGVLLCILSPIPLILLGGASEGRLLGITEGFAAGTGILTLLVLIAAAVSMFILCGMRMSRFEYINKEKWETEYGVTGLVREVWKASADSYAIKITAGIAALILSPIPLIIAGVSGAKEIICVLMTALLLAVVAVAVYVIIVECTFKGACDRLLGEGEYYKVDFEDSKRTERFGGIYWPIVTAGYLAWSFISSDWEITWIVWPIAGLLFAAISAALKKN